MEIQQLKRRISRLDAEVTLLMGELKPYTYVWWKLDEIESICFNVLDVLNHMKTEEE